MSKNDPARGNSLRITRIDAGVTQTELANYCGVTRQQIQKWETGERPLLQAPYDEMINWLAKRKTQKRNIRRTTVAADRYAVLDYLRRP
jgi:transcriptional regulator with XRE-family HTH domain